MTNRSQKSASVHGLICVGMEFSLQAALTPGRLKPELRTSRTAICHFSLVICHLSLPNQRSTTFLPVVNLRGAFVVRFFWCGSVGPWSSCLRGEPRLW